MVPFSSDAETIRSSQFVRRIGTTGGWHPGNCCGADGSR